MIKEPYIERLCQLSKTSLKIFAGSEAYSHLSTNGLIEIPIQSIARVERVKYNIRAKSHTLKNTIENQFEIILKQ